MDIRFIPHEEIDKIKWNSCVHYANNGNVFGYMWYLNSVCKEWHGLVEGGYESVFPVVWRKKKIWGEELYQPDLARELGLYSVHVLSPKRVSAFLEAIPNNYKKSSIHLNERIKKIDEKLGYKTQKKSNYQLALNQDYETLAKNFSPDVKEKIHAAEQKQLFPTSSIKPEVLADFYKKHNRSVKGINQNFHALQRIMYNALHRGYGFATGVLNQKKELCAVDFFIYSHAKALSLMFTTSEEGKTNGAPELMLDLFIRNHENRPLVLDFNGNEKYGQQFGAMETNYLNVSKGGLF